VRDDFIAHVRAGGSAEVAIAEVRHAYPRSLMDKYSYAQVILTLAMTAWEIGQLSPVLKSDALFILDTLPPPPGVSETAWRAQTRAIAQRLRRVQPDKRAFA
jgi:hypothetical protein